MKCFLLLTMSILLITTRVSGQATSPQGLRQNNALKYGFGYFGHYKLSPKWGLHTDVQFRMDEQLKFSFQNVFRGGLIRYLKPNLYVVGGYALLTTHSEIFEDYYTEHRLFEQLSYSKTTRLHTFSFRLRAEQRFVEKLKFSPTNEAETDKYLYGNRLRFFNRTSFDLTKKPEAANIFYLAFQDEFFLNIDAPEINRNLFDQNRFLVVFGVFKDRNTRLETGYANIFLNPYKRDNQIIHSLHFAVVQTLDFSKKE